MVAMCLTVASLEPTIDTPVIVISSVSRHLGIMQLITIMPSCDNGESYMDWRCPLTGSRQVLHICGGHSLEQRSAVDWLHSPPLTGLSAGWVVETLCCLSAIAHPW